MAFVDARARSMFACFVLIFLSLGTTPSVAGQGQPEKNATIKPSGDVLKLADHANYITPRAAVRCSEHSTCRLEDFIRDTRVCALFVIQNREIRTKLFNEDTRVCVEGGRNSLQKRFGVASVAKSITSTWLGQALADRYHIKTKAQFEATVQTQVGHFLSGDDRRALASSYSPLSLDQVLRMRSGIAWREQSRPRLFSDEILFGRMVRERPSRSTIVGFASGYKPKLGLAEFNYSALDASVAAVVSASISRVHSYAAFQNSIWRMIGAAQPARWNTDVDLIPIGSCCFSARVDDLARFGDFVLNKGNGQIPSGWFDLATEPELGATRKSRRPQASKESCNLDYGYYWWLRPGRTDFTAFGRDGQFIHIYPDTKTVVVQISDWQLHQDDPEWRCQALRMHDSLVGQLK